MHICSTNLSIWYATRQIQFGFLLSQEGDGLRWRLEVGGGGCVQITCSGECWWWISSGMPLLCTDPFWGLCYPLSHKTRLWNPEKGQGIFLEDIVSSQDPGPRNQDPGPRCLCGLCWCFAWACLEGQIAFGCLSTFFLHLSSDFVC